MKDLKTRIISAIIFGLFMIVGLFFNIYLYLFMILFIAGGCIMEFYRITTRTYTTNGRFTQIYPYISIGNYLFVSCLVLAYTCGLIPLKSLLIIPVLFFIYFIIELFSHSDKPIIQLGLHCIVFIYLICPFSLLHLIAVDNAGQFIGPSIFGILLVIWTNDSGAYIIGSQIGKHSLFKRISPKKTIEGSIGGILCAFIMSIICAYCIPTYALIDWLIIAAIVSIFASLGDLIESMFKRSLHIKDSGSIMPGHGGFLDRFDAFIFVIPFVVCYICYLRPLLFS